MKKNIYLKWLFIIPEANFIPLSHEELSWTKRFVNINLLDYSLGSRAERKVGGGGEKSKVEFWVEEFKFPQGDGLS